MWQTICLFVGVALICALLLRPRPRLNIDQLPKLFNDEPEGVVEFRPDLAKKRNADETFQFRTLRTRITISSQRVNGVHVERYEVTYRACPMIMIDLEDGRPTLFCRSDSEERQEYFIPREIRAINIFVQHLRTRIRLTHAPG